MQEKKTTPKFKSVCGASDRIFPVDYSQRGFARYLEDDPRAVHRYIVDHELFRQWLKDQRYREGVKEEEKEREKNASASIPAESALFFREYYHLATGRYHTAMCSGRREKLDAVLPEFTRDLCERLREEMEKDDAGSRHCRCALYDVPLFQRESMAGFWDRELDRRVEQMKQLAGQIDGIPQLRVLMDMALNLDRGIINLQDAKTMPPAADGSLLTLLEALVQREKVSGKNRYASYLVENVPLREPVAGANTLQEAFWVLNADSKRPPELQRLEEAARDTYLRRLDEAGKDSAFGTMYREAEGYFRLRSGKETERLLEQLVAERCRQHCAETLDRCRLEPDPRPTAETVGRAMEQLQYAAILANTLVTTKFAEILRQYDDTIRLITCLRMAQLSEERRQARRAAMPAELRPQLETVERYCPEVEPGKNLTLQEALRFRDLFAAMWQQLYNEAVFDPENGLLRDRRKTAETLWRDGREAAAYFGGSVGSHHSPDTVETMLRRYEELLLHPTRYYPYEALLDFALPLLTFGLAMVLRREVQACIPAVTADLRQLLELRSPKEPK